MGWKQVILIISSLLALVLLYILPTPNADYRNIQIEEKTEEDVNLTNGEKIKKALEIIEKGGAPMKGILLLKEVEADEPQNEEALFYLGEFSVKSGQFDKAIPRFVKLVEMKPQVPQYWFKLAQVYELNKNSDKAVSAYQTFINFDTDSIIVEDVRARIKKLKKLDIN
jgi:tetratricopeptide (TPR) repeat protein